MKDILEKILEQEVGENGYVPVSIFDLGRLQKEYREVVIDKKEKLTVGELYDAVRPLFLDVILPKEVIKNIYEGLK